MFRDLRSFLDALRARGELITVEAEVDPDLEIAEIHRRVISAGGPALLFRRPKGSPFPVVTNLMGTRARVDLALGNHARTFVAALAAAPHTLLPPGLRKLWDERRTLGRLLRVGLR